MRVKSPSVNIADLPEEVKRLFPILDEVWGECGYTEPVCTSGCEDVPGHKSTSLHYRRNWTAKRQGAIDLRTRFLSIPAQDDLVDELRDRLDRDYPHQYDIVNHNGQDNVPRHVHIEYDNHN